MCEVDVDPVEIDEELAPRAEEIGERDLAARRGDARVPRSPDASLGGSEGGHVGAE